MKKRNKFYLVDYKGKCDVVQDHLYEIDYEVGKISKEDLIKQAKNRKANSLYYGIPAYIGDDKELNKIFK